MMEHTCHSGGMQTQSMDTTAAEGSEAPDGNRVVEARCISSSPRACASDREGSEASKLKLEGRGDEGGLAPRPHLAPKSAHLVDR